MHERQYFMVPHARAAHLGCRAQLGIQIILRLLFGQPGPFSYLRGTLGTFFLGNIRFPAG